MSSFNRGVAIYLGRLPAIWVEGEVTELRRNPAWATVFITLKDPKTAVTLKMTIARNTFDRLELALDEGETVHVAGRAELCELEGSSGCGRRRSSVSASGEHLVALEQPQAPARRRGSLRAARKRALPRVPRAVGILTGADAAARGDS